MGEYSIPSPFHRKQFVRVDDEGVTLFPRPNDVPICYWALEEIVDVHFFWVPDLNGRKPRTPVHGEVRLARTWAERRQGLFAEQNKNAPIGVRFEPKFQYQAHNLLDEILAHPKFSKGTDNYIAQVETEFFVLTLYQSELVITERAFFVSVAASISGDSENTIPLSRVNGISFSEARDDKLRFGSFSGTITISGVELDWVRTFSKSNQMNVQEFALRANRHLETLVKVKSVDASPSSPTSLADELAKLQGLRDSGALTEDEFSSAKAKLLES